MHDMASFAGSLHSTRGCIPWDCRNRIQQVLNRQSFECDEVGSPWPTYGGSDPLMKVGDNFGAKRWQGIGGLDPSSCPDLPAGCCAVGDIEAYAGSRDALLAGSDAKGLLTATPSEGRHSWHNEDFAATAAAGQHDSFRSTAGRMEQLADRPRGKRTARTPRDASAPCPGLGANLCMAVVPKLRRGPGFIHMLVESWMRTFIAC